ncbi:MAG: hypothetical protein KatS3mg076_0820 [Candidatus Binatia bacterium]|nr:MAG: hypothetical protein KatS3mg076_0820 [Candidatus Binatia bacterium]
MSVSGKAPAYETRDVRPGALVGLALAFFVLLAGAALFTFELWGALRSRPRVESPLAELRKGRLPPEPRLQPEPIRDLEELRRAEDELLGTYGWVDRERGIVRIPVERAMELVLAEKGGGPP